MTHLAVLTEISHAGPDPQFPYVLVPALVESSCVQPISIGIEGSPRPIQSLCDNCHTLIATYASDSVDDIIFIHPPVISTLYALYCMNVFHMAVNRLWPLSHLT
jgi:hypothetical protein